MRIDASTVARESVSRVDQFHLFHRQRKRIEAGQQGLEMLAQEPSLQSSVQMAREMVAAAPEDKQLPMLRAALVTIGERSAALATGKVAPLAGLAMAVWEASVTDQKESPSAPAGKAALQALAFDPLAATLAQAGGGGECLQLLSAERPREARALATFAGRLETLSSGPRQAGQRLLAQELGSQLLTSLPPGALKPGLDAIASGKSELAIAAAAASGLGPDDCATHRTSLLAPLPQEWRDWTDRLLAAAPDSQSKGRLVQLCLRGAEQQAERSQVVEGFLAKTSEPPLELATELVAGLSERDPRLNSFLALGQQLGLSGGQLARGAMLQAKNDKLTHFQVAAQVASADKLAALLGAMQSDQRAAPLALGLEELVKAGAEPKPVLTALAAAWPLVELVCGLDGLLQKVGDKTVRVQAVAACLDHWQQLAQTPDEQDGLALARDLAALEYRDPSKGADIFLRYALPGFKPGIRGDRVAYVANRLQANLTNPVDQNDVALTALETLKNRYPDVVAILKSTCAALPEDQQRPLLLTAFKVLSEQSFTDAAAFARSVLKTGSSDIAASAFARVAAERLAHSSSGALQPQMALAAGIAAHRTGYPGEVKSAIYKIFELADPASPSVPQKLGQLTQKSAGYLTSDPVDALTLGRLCWQEVGRQADLRPEPASGVLKACQSLHGVKLATPRQQQALNKVLVDGLAATATHDPGWLAATLTTLVGQLDEASGKTMAAPIVQALDAAARAYRDDKLAPPVLDALQRDLAAPGDPRPVLKKHLTALARHQGEAYKILAQTRPEQLGGVEEQADAVIVGGVRVKKASE
ncbi:MAG: hypothetical protein AMXMBFR33_30640 [Candidatus Xenobia bacterium]